MSARTNWRLLGLCAAITLSAPLLPQRAGAQPYRLEDQRVEGTRRVCVYRYLNREQLLRVGRGEPCPARYRRPVAVRQGIPAFATLQGRSREGGRPVCVYTYQQRTYRQPGSASGFCPYTPVAAPR